MSRARDFIDPVTNEVVWFDVEASKARADQLELLADWEDLDLDDLLDEGLSQRQVLWRLRLRATPEIIPPHVIERKRQRELLRGRWPSCRVCVIRKQNCEGRITRHHFVPRWLMLTLTNYSSYAPRVMCTIPVCVGQHRDFHLRSGRDKSVLPYLRSHERKFAHKMLHELEVEHPSIFELALNGDFHAYEHQLVQDFVDGLFLSDEGCYTLPEYK